MNSIFACAAALLCAAFFSAPVQARETVPLTQWKFAPSPGQTGPQQPNYDDSRWQAVTVPHTWNSKTETRTYRAAWYRTHFSLTAAGTRKEIFVCFDGAGTVADVSVNGVYSRDAPRRVHAVLV